MVDFAKENHRRWLARHHPLVDTVGGCLRVNLGKGYCVRRTTDPKYLYPRGFKSNEQIFAVATDRETILIVEGLFDALAVERFSEEYGAISVFNAHMGRKQAKKIAEDYGDKHICIAMDGDKAGIYGARRGLARLLAAGVDIGDISIASVQGDPEEHFLQFPDVPMEPAMWGIDADILQLAVGMGDNKYLTKMWVEYENGDLVGQINWEEESV